MLGHWEWVIAKGVLIGQLLLIALGIVVFVVGPWLYDRAPRWPRRGGVRLRLILLIVLPFAAGILISLKLRAWFAAGGPPAIVQVDPATLEKERVDPTPGILERAQLGRVQPTQVRIGTAPSAAGIRRVELYCAPAAALTPVQTSAKPVPVPDSATERGTGPRILPDFNGRVNGSRAFLASTLNDGTPWDATYKVRGRWTFASVGDSVVVRSERFWSRLARGLVRCGAIAGAGAGVGVLADLSQPLQGAARGAAIGGGTCAALELAF